MTDETARAVLAALGFEPFEDPRCGFRVRGVHFVHSAPTLPALAEACLRSVSVQLGWFPGDLAALESKRRQIDEEQERATIAHNKLYNRYQAAILLARKDGPCKSDASCWTSTA